MWIRSWTQDVYLWYRELRDENVELYDSPQQYFQSRKTTATTSSGTPKDRFHYSVNTKANDERVSSGASTGYGMKIKFSSPTPETRQAVVLYVEPGSPADIANISRGDEIISVDNADLISGNDLSTLRSGLFPRQNNENHSFEIINAYDGSSRIVNLTSATVVAEPVKNTKYFIDSTSGEKVGYMTFNTFGTYSAEGSLANSFNWFAEQQVSDLVLDLRYNTGGFLVFSSQLAYMIAGPENTNNKTFYQTVYNDKYPYTKPNNNDPIVPYPFLTTGLGASLAEGTQLPTLNLSRVFVLTTKDTCSASEALINGLRGVDVEVIQIGDKTCGKPYGFVGTDNCGTTYYSIMFKGVNEIGYGDYTDGFYPYNSPQSGSALVEGCYVPDDFSKQLGDKSEALLSTALYYRNNYSCPFQSRTILAAKKSINFESSQIENLLNNPRIQSTLNLERNLLINKSLFSGNKLGYENQ